MSFNRTHSPAEVTDPCNSDAIVDKLKDDDQGFSRGN